MGLTLTKSPQERRNTVLRRSQRKSFHRIRNNTATIMKQINKFKGDSENDLIYQEIFTKIEKMSMETESKSKELQPQVRNVHDETLRKLQECRDALQAKLTENQNKVKESKKIEEPVEELTNTEDDEIRKSRVELNLVQLEVLSENEDEEKEQKPVTKNKRNSLMKLGVQVFPMMSNMINSPEVNPADLLVESRQIIEKCEAQIFEFQNNTEDAFPYEKVHDSLDQQLTRLANVRINDEITREQVKLITNYANTTLNALEEKFLPPPVEDEVFYDSKDVLDSSKKGVKTTYI